MNPQNPQESVPTEFHSSTHHSEGYELQSADVHKSDEISEIDGQEPVDTET